MNNLITITNLSKTHNEGKQSEKKVFENVNLSIVNGSFIAVVGKNGSGKTTLLNVICGLEDFDKGEINFTLKNGKNTITQTLKPNTKLGPVLRKRIGHVSQRASLWPHFNIFQNVVRPLIDCEYENSVEDAKNKALFHLNSIFGLNESLDSMSFYKKYPKELSGGEYKRVALARVFATNPDILILDEFEASLDPWVVEDLLRYLEKNFVDAEGKSVLMVTHRSDLITRLASKIIVVNNGSVKKFDSLEKMVKSNDPDAVSWLDVKRDPNSVSGQAIFFTKSLVENINKAYSKPIKYKTNIDQLLVDAISGFVSKVDRKYPHLILLVSKKDNKHYIRGIKTSKTENQEFELSGKNIENLNRLVSRSTVDNQIKHKLKNKYAIRKTAGDNGMLFNSGGSLIASMLNTTNIEQFKYKYDPYPPVIGVYGESSERFSEDTNKPYMEFSKGTKSVYLFPIKNQKGTADAVISIDTYSMNKWLPFVVERLQMIVDVGANLINQ